MTKRKKRVRRKRQEKKRLKRKGKRTPQRTAPRRPPTRREVPIRDYWQGIDLDVPGNLDEALEVLTSDLCNGYFLRWEGVVRQEQGLSLSEAQQEALSELISFDDDEDTPTLYINEMPRPREPWYQSARELIARLPRVPFRTETFDYYLALSEGWPDLAECVVEYGLDLSLPEGVTDPLDVFDVELRHRLWLQYCFDMLHGLGQDAELTLENEEQRWRIDEFVERLQEHVDSVRHFDLTLEKLLTMVVLPSRDSEIFAELMTERLGLTGIQDRLANALEPDT